MQNKVSYSMTWEGAPEDQDMSVGKERYSIPQALETLDLLLAELREANSALNHFLYRLTGNNYGEAQESKIAAECYLDYFHKYTTACLAQVNHLRETINSLNDIV